MEVQERGDGPGCEHCVGFGRVTRKRGIPTRATFGGEPCRHCGYGNFPGTTVAGRLVAALGEPRREHDVEGDARWSWGRSRAAFVVMFQDDEGCGVVQVADAGGTMRTILRSLVDKRGTITIHEAVNLLRGRL